MPKLSKADEEKLPQIRDGLAHLCASVTLLIDSTGLAQRAVAESMKMNAGSLSELLGDPGNGRMPSRTLQQATQGLRALMDSYPGVWGSKVGAAIDEHLSTLESAWGWERQVLAQPGEYLPLNARNYVERECDRDLWNRVGAATTLLIAGPPQSGRSAMVGRCAERITAEERSQLVLVDLRGPLQNDCSLEDAYEAIGKAIGAEAQCRDAGSLSDLISAWLADGRCTLVLDGLNSGSLAVVPRLLEQVRVWSSYRSLSMLKAHKPWGNFAVWCVLTSQDVRDARYASSAHLTKAIGSSNAVTTRWWTKDETSAFAGHYADPPGVGRLWRSGTIGAIIHWFGGQPYLTHSAIAACFGGGASDTSHGSAGKKEGESAVESWLASNPPAVRAHLDRLGQTIATHRETVDAIDATGVRSWVPFLEEWEVAGGQEMTLTCHLYEEHFRTYLARARSLRLEEASHVESSARS